MYDDIVIGAGHNGLIAAGYLARSGRRVLVLERRSVVGGACVTEEVWPGYHVSTGAYLCSLLDPQIVQDLEMERFGFVVTRRSPSGFVPQKDGSYLFHETDPDAARAELERFCRDTPDDVDAYARFEADVEQAADIVDGWMRGVTPNQATLRQAFVEAGAEPLYAPFMQGSVRDLLEPRFANAALKATLATDGLIGTYGGPSTPGTAYVLLHHYLGSLLGGRGAWGYVRGGMGGITQALAAFVREKGGEIRTDAPIRQILTEASEAQSGQSRRRAVGVELETGEQILAKTVLSNADPYTTFARLLPTENETEQTNEVNTPSWMALKTQGGASVKINLAVSELPRFRCLPDWQTRPQPGPEHRGTVHLLPDLDYLERAWEEAAQGHPSSQPMIEMYMQTATEPTLAPPGKHMVSLFVQYFPYNLAPGLDFATEKQAFYERVVGLVTEYAPNFAASIEQVQILTPRDLEARFGLTGGHIFHGDLLPPNLWDERSAPSAHGANTTIMGLYLCGSGAHPGGCVYGLPGYNAAQTVLRAGNPS